MKYKDILTNQYNEYNRLYKQINKICPAFSKEFKDAKAMQIMMDNRKKMMPENPITIYEMGLTSQYQCEILAFEADRNGEVTRYFINDESLFDFFRQTELNKKALENLYSQLSDEGMCIGLIGKTQSYCIYMSRAKTGAHVFDVLTDEQNYTFVAEYITGEPKENLEIYKIVINFLFYINAFKDMVTDGVPSEAKRINNAKTISVSTKIVSHTTREGGIVKPHYRSGHFRYYPANSEHWVNVRGKTIFVEATIVKSKAKTVAKCK